MRSRLAPTPSGYLHWGNLLNFVLTWIYTRKNHGVLQLRIDDLDAARSRPEYIIDIFETLQWLGFDWDVGPKSPDDFIKNFSQTRKTEYYREWLKCFPGYACECSRQEIQQRCNSTYDGRCRDKSLPLIKGKTQWRVREETPANDIILWRKDDMPAYHLVSLIEDISFGTTLIIRGEDLIDSTKAQLRLSTMLGTQGTPFAKAQFIHHPLILDTNGGKMSKSAGATSLKYCRESGYTQEDVFAELSQRSKWPVTVTSLTQAIQQDFFQDTHRYRLTSREDFY